MVLAWRADCRVVCLELGTGSQTSRVTFSWVCPQLESDVTDTNASPHSLVIHARQLAREKRRAPLAWVSITAVLWQRQRHRRPRITLVCCNLNVVFSRECTSDVHPHSLKCWDISHRNSSRGKFFSSFIRRSQGTASKSLSRLRHSKVIVRPRFSERFIPP